MKVVLVGASGAMGQTIVRIIKQEPSIEIYAGIQNHAHTQETFPVFNQLEALTQYIMQSKTSPDIIIDFSTPNLTTAVLAFARQHHLPVLIATTGQSEQQIKELKQAAEYIPLLYSQNTSLGMAAFQKIVQEMFKMLYPLGYDSEIIEVHHRYKKDAPSGTALMLRDAMLEGVSDSIQTVYSRYERTSARQHNEIGIHSVRAGNIVGEHKVIFSNNSETIELVHRAENKELFAKGALICSQFLVEQPVGLYTMSDVMKYYNY